MFSGSRKQSTKSDAYVVPVVTRDQCWLARLLRIDCDYSFHCQAEWRNRRPGRKDLPSRRVCHNRSNCTFANDENRLLDREIYPLPWRYASSKKHSYRKVLIASLTVERPRWSATLFPWGVIVGMRTLEARTGFDQSIERVSSMREKSQAHSCLVDWETCRACCVRANRCDWNWHFLSNSLRGPLLFNLPLVTHQSTRSHPIIFYLGSFLHFSVLVVHRQCMGFRFTWSIQLVISLLCLSSLSLSRSFAFIAQRRRIKREREKKSRTKFNILMFMHIRHKVALSPCPSLKYRLFNIIS